MNPPKRPYRIGQGQVSVEILMAVVMILFLFLVVQLFIEQTKMSAAVSQQNVREDEVCAKLSTIITYMSSNPPYTETIFELSLDTNVINGYIFVGDTFCGFLGRAQNTQLYPGHVKAFDLNGLVVFTNDVNYSPFNPPQGPPGSGSNQSGGVLLLIDDQGMQWSAEVAADDVSYAISPDNASVELDWVEFRFPNLGLTPSTIMTDVRFLANHFESSHLGLGGPKSMVQCYEGPTEDDWVDVNNYIPSFTELYFQSGNVVSCIGDWNTANNARFRMTYEPNGVGDTISIDYGRIDVNYSLTGLVIDLWEHTSDLPQPVDFRTDINSIANTFGGDAGNDGWDWSRNHFGGTILAAQFNADPNYDGGISDSNVGNAERIELKLGGGVPGAPTNPDDNSTIGMATSGAYGIQFDINSQHWTDIQGGAQLWLSFIYQIDADAGWGNALDSPEKGWVKARFGQNGNMVYLGSDLDTNSIDADPTNEIWWQDPPTDYTGFFLEDVSSYVTGAGVYYFEVGGGISDWDSVALGYEGMGIYIDNINLGVV